MRFGLGPWAAARFMVALTAMSKTVRDSPGRVSDSAASTSPFGRTWIQRGCYEAGGEGVDLEAGCRDRRAAGGPAAGGGHLERGDAALRPGGRDGGLGAEGLRARRRRVLAEADGRGADQRDAAGDDLGQSHERKLHPVRRRHLAGGGGGPQASEVRVAVAQAALERAEQEREADGHHEIEEGHHVVGLEEAEGAGGIDLAELGDVGDAEDGDERAVLDEGDEVVAERRQDGADRLRQDDEAEALPGGEAERLGRLDLAAGRPTGCRRGTPRR